MTQAARVQVQPADETIDLIREKLVASAAVAEFDDSRVSALGTPTPLVTSVQVKMSRATGTPRLVVRGAGIVAGSAVVEVGGERLATTRYKDVAADGTSGRLIAVDADFDMRVPRGVRVQVTVLDPKTGRRSAPVDLTR